MKRNPKGIRFNDLCKICDHFFGKPRKRGTSHRIYRTPWPGNPRVNIQNSAGKAKARWQVELFFKWIKQHLRIKKFYGNSENAVKVQIWTAISVYVLVAIVKKRLHLDASLYTLLQIFSVTVFEKIPLNKDFLDRTNSSDDDMYYNQLNLFGS